MERPAHDCSRRDFLKGTGAILGGVAAAPTFGRAADETTTGTKVPESVLGRTGVKVGKLGIGCAYFGFRKQVTPVDVRKTLERALELGVTYLDTAPVYGSDESGWAETKMGPAI